MNEPLLTLRKIEINKEIKILLDFPYIIDSIAKIKTIKDWTYSMLKYNGHIPYTRETYKSLLDLRNPFTVDKSSGTHSNIVAISSKNDHTSIAETKKSALEVLPKVDIAKAASIESKDSKSLSIAWKNKSYMKNINCDQKAFKFIKSTKRKNVVPYIVRHRFAIHILENLMRIAYLQKKMEQMGIKTEHICTHITNARLENSKSEMCIELSKKRKKRNLSTEKVWI